MGDAAEGAGEEVAVVIVEVEAVAFAVAPLLAGGALSFAGPEAVAVGLEAVVPHLPEAVVVDVTLVEVAAYGGAAGDAAVAEDGGYLDAGTAEIVLVAHLAFVWAEVALAGVVADDAPFLAGAASEVEEPCELLARELQLGVVSGTSHREDGEEAPALAAEGDKVLLDSVKLIVVAWVDTGYDIPEEVVLFGEEADGTRGAVEGIRGLPHPVVVALEAVERDGDRMESAVEKAVETTLVEEVSVGDKPPGEAAAIELEAAGVEVGTEEGFAACEDDEDLMGVDVGGDVVDSLEEVGSRHIGRGGANLAIAATVATVHVATERTFPKECAKRVELGLVVAVLAPEFFFEVHASGGLGWLEWLEWL